MPRSLLTIASILTIAFVTGRCDRANAYVLTGREWWPDAYGEPDVTLPYSFSNFLDGGLLDASGTPVPETQLREAVEEAFSVWASVAPLHFVEVQDEWDGEPISDGLYPAGQYGTIRIGHHAIDGFGSVKAHAYFPPATSTPICNLCGDVHFDNRDRWELIGTLEYPDVLGGAIHELGHSLGLGHTDVEEANMYWVFRRHSGPGSGWLHPDDIAGIQAIYGAGVGSVTPLSAIPEPSAALVAGLLWAVAAWRCRRWHCTQAASAPF